MNYFFIKKVAIFVILAFTLSVVFPGYNFPQDKGGIKEDLDVIKNSYEKNDFKEIRDLIEKFISKYGSDKMKYREELRKVYYIKAKIHFIFDEKNEMEDTLRELYKMNPDFRLPDDENEEFRNIARAIQKEIKAHKIKINIYVKSENQDILQYSVDNLDPAISFQKNDFELELEPGFHDFYFFSKNDVRNFHEEVFEGKPLNFNVKFNTIIKPGNKKKKFPVLLVVLSVAAVGVVISVLMSKKKTEKEKTLNVTRGEGIDGGPATGSYMHKQGRSINYSYTLKDGYINLIVKLDGADAPASGTITMDKDHTLTALATAQQTYTLTVTKGEGVDGTPAGGTFSYNEGKTVNYNYTLQSGYEKLVVTIDGAAAAASGTITMNANHTLSASATPITGFTLTVTQGPGVNGNPTTGVYSYNQGAAVSYSYTLADNTYKDLIVKIDGTSAPANGTITMNGNHTLSATATKIYQLTVSLAEGVDGTPAKGIYDHSEGEIVPYNYILKTGYKDLAVTIDGVAAAASSTITMNKKHTINVTAVKKQYKLTVIKNDGVNGTPGSGTYYYDDGANVAYSYRVAGSSGTVIVTVDGVTKPSSGDITMNKDHTLTATWQPPGDSKYTNAAQEPIAALGKAIK